MIHPIQEQSGWQLVRRGYSPPRSSGNIRNAPLPLRRTLTSHYSFILSSTCLPKPTINRHPSNDSHPPMNSYMLIYRTPVPPRPRSTPPLAPLRDPTTVVIPPTDEFSYTHCPLHHRFPHPIPYFFLPNFPIQPPLVRTYERRHALADVIGSGGKQI